MSTIDLFFEQFDRLAEAPNGVEKLRELVLQMAMLGKLVTQEPDEPPIGETLQQIEKERRSRNGAPLIPVESDGLPSGWAWVRMGDISDHRLGKMLDKGKNRGDFYPYLRNTNVQWFRFELDDVKQMRFLEDEIEEFEVRVGDLLVCEGGEPGRCAVWAEPSQRMMFQKAIHRIRPLGGICPQFLALRLRLDAVTGRLSERFTGATIKHFTGQEMKRYLLPLPPVPEQRRIVAKVDQLMALCDELEARQQAKRETRERLVASALDTLTSARDASEFDTHWHRLRDHFDLLFDHPSTIPPLRQALLQLAILGKIVPHDPSDEDSSILLERIRNERKQLIEDRLIKTPKPLPSISPGDSDFDLPKGWSLIWSGELFTFITSGSRGWAAHYSDRGPLFLRIGNLDYETIHLNLDNLQRVEPPDSAESRRTAVRPGDILVSVTGDTGMVGLIPPDFEEAYINQHIALMRPTSHVNATWAARFFTSPYALQCLKRAQRGIKNSLGLEDVRLIPMPLPPFNEQCRIAAKIDQLMTLCDELEARQQQSTGKSYAFLTSTVAHLLNGSATTNA